MIVKAAHTHEEHIVQIDAHYQMEWHVGAYGYLKVIFEQRCSMQEVLTHITCVLEEGAQLELVPIIIEGEQSELVLNVQLHASAHAIITGTYALHQIQKSTIRVHQHHLEKGSTSHVIINGVAHEHSMIDYSGLITIEKEASKSVAAQENKTLLWSEKAKAQSIPSLEVKTNDVQCAHGSAIGHLHKEHVWYAQARGMSMAQAQKLLLKSFFSQTLPVSINEALIEELTQKIIAQKGLV